MFGLCQIFAFIEYVRARLTKEYFETLLKAVLITVFSAAVVVGVILSITGKQQITLKSARMMLIMIMFNIFVVNLVEKLNE